MRSTTITWAKVSDSNVCVVDWSRLANYDYALAAMRHTKIVADAVVNFMKFLTQHGMNVKQVSIAGHSLGAHIAGYIGESFRGDIHTIYGRACFSLTILTK